MRTPLRFGLRFLVTVFASGLAAGCDGGQTAPPADSLEAHLPALPPTGGAQTSFAGRLTEANYSAERVGGPASQGLVGDYFMRNDKIRLVVQAPGRDIAVVPFGGNVIDADLVDHPQGDQLGEVGPFLQLGRTVDFNRGEVVRDGSAGGPAVLRFYGHDALDAYINISGLGSFAKAINDDYRADIDLKLDVAVTYVLAPGAAHVQAIYTFWNPNEFDRQTTFGSITDTGAQVEIFHPGKGFGESGFSDLFSGGTGLSATWEYFALQGQGIAYGVLPIYGDKVTRGAGLAISGVDVEINQEAALPDAFGGKGQTLVVASKGAATRTTDIIVARDLGGIEAVARAEKGDATVEVSGVVTRAGGGAKIAGARVAVELANAKESQLVTVLTSDDGGRFSARLAPNAYTFTAEADGFLRGDASTTTLAVGNATAMLSLTVPAGALVDYKVHDRAGNLIPAKVVIVGKPPAIPDHRFRDVTKDSLPLGVAAWRTSLEGDSSKSTRWDQPIRLVPGRYRIVVGHGPEWNRFEQAFDLTEKGAAFDVTLDRVIDTKGYVASDFHQHTNWSPDAPVPPMDRVAGYVADGVEVAATTEHDTHFDMEPVVKMLGVDHLLTTFVGVEVTPFSYGHFIAFPVPVNAMSPSGGAVDWTFDAASGLDQAPGEIFASLRKLGAQVIQMNHPRATPDRSTDAFSTFQQNFDRAGLTYDFANRTFGGSQKLQAVTAAELGLPDGAELFSPDFDTLEVYNGGGFYETLEGDRRVDARTEQVLRDWMNFLSFGFLPTALGDSDSHDWFTVPPGTPRSMVRVKDDGPGAIAGGLTDEVVASLKGKGVPRDVVVTNAPMLSFTADGKSIGETAQHAAGPIQIAVRAQTPAWAPVDTVEIYANATFQVPPPKGQKAELLMPAICFTSRMVPSQRCTSALGGARPLAWQKVEVAPGAFRLEANLTAAVDPADLVSRQRPGAQGKDVWLVARAIGDVGLFPFIPFGIADAADLPGLVEGGAGGGQGVPAHAFTNPIFVDVDGGGWKAPFAH